MAGTTKTEERRRKAAEFRRFAAEVRGTTEKMSPAALLQCLGLARSSEQQAASSRLAREVLSHEISGGSAPEELGDEAIARCHASASESYACAATAYVAGGDWCRAFRYLHKAAREQLRCAAFAVAEPGAAEKAARYGRRAALLRQEVARRSLCRKRFSMGLLGRLR